MTRIDPIALTETLLRLGLVDEAVAMLEKAVASEPTRQDLLVRLGQVRRMASSSGRLLVALHLAMAWVLLVTCFVIAFSPPILVGRLYLDGPAPGPEFYVMPHMLVMLGAAAIGAVVLACLAMQLFLHTWFYYLKHFARADRDHVERLLPSHMRVSAFGDAYERVRARFFPEPPES